MWRKALREGRQVVAKQQEKGGKIRKRHRGRALFMDIKRAVVSAFPEILSLSSGDIETFWDRLQD